MVQKVEANNILSKMFRVARFGTDSEIARVTSQYTLSINQSVYFVYKPVSILCP
jgi:hypothetical protein